MDKHKDWRPCPVDGCKRSRRAQQIMCSTHWYQVPQWLRDQVWKAFREHPGSREHVAAIRSAIEAAGTTEQVERSGA